MPFDQSITFPPNAKFQPEALLLDRLVTEAALGPEKCSRISASAADLVRRIRSQASRARCAGWSNAGEPFIRTAVGRAMREMGRQFVLGQIIDAALDRAMTREAQGFTYSYDMLGGCGRGQPSGRRRRCAGRTGHPAGRRHQPRSAGDAGRHFGRDLVG